MEEKKALNNEELKNTVGGGRGRRPGYYIICNMCGKVLSEDVLPERVEECLKIHRATHKCSPLLCPSDIVERHY